VSMQEEGNGKLWNKPRCTYATAPSAPVHSAAGKARQPGACRLRQAWKAVVRRYAYAGKGSAAWQWCVWCVRTNAPARNWQWQGIGSSAVCRMSTACAVRRCCRFSSGGVAQETVRRKARLVGLEEQRRGTRGEGNRVPRSSRAVRLSRGETLA